MSFSKERKITIPEKIQRVASAAAVAGGLWLGGLGGVAQLRPEVRADSGDGGRADIVAPLNCEEDESYFGLSVGVDKSSVLSSYGLPERTFYMSYTNELGEPDVWTGVTSSENGTFQYCFREGHVLVNGQPVTVTVDRTPFELTTDDGNLYGCDATCRPFSLSYRYDEVENKVRPSYVIYSPYYVVVGTAEPATPTPTPTRTPFPTSTPTPTPEATPTPTVTPLPTATSTPEVCEAELLIDGYVENGVEGLGISAVAGVGVFAESSNGTRIEGVVLDDRGDALLRFPSTDGESQEVQIEFIADEDRFQYIPRATVQDLVCADEPLRVPVGFSVQEDQGPTFDSRILLPLVRND